MQRRKWSSYIYTLLLLLSLHNSSPLFSLRSENIQSKTDVFGYLDQSICFISTIKLTFSTLYNCVHNSISRLNNYLHIIKSVIVFNAFLFIESGRNSASPLRFSPSLSLFALVGYSIYKCVCVLSVLIIFQLVLVSWRRDEDVLQCNLPTAALSHINSKFKVRFMFEFFLHASIKKYSCNHRLDIFSAGKNWMISIEGERERVENVRKKDNKCTTSNMRFLYGHSKMIKWN